MLTASEYTKSIGSVLHNVYKELYITLHLQPVSFITIHQRRSHVSQLDTSDAVTPATLRSDDSFLLSFLPI